MTKRRGKKRGIGRWGHEAPNIHLRLVKMRIVESAQRTHLMHPLLFCFSALAVTQTWIGSSFFYLPQPNRIPDFRAGRLMITDIERALLSDPCDPEP